VPTLKLTDAAIKRFKRPATGRIEFWDSHTRGFGLRLSASGVQSWVVITRSLQAGQWKQQRVTLGSYPSMTLAEARKKAVEAMASAKKGDDPAAAVKAERTALVDSSRNSFGTVRAEFLAKHIGRKDRRPKAGTLAEMQRVLSADEFAAWADAPLANVTKRDVQDVLDGIAARGAPVMANRTLSYLRLMFGWAAHRGIIESDPTAGIKKSGAETSRNRVLSLAELRVIWEATASDRTQFNSIVRLLMLTGQRLNEIAGMHWSEVVEDYAIAHDDHGNPTKTCTALVLPPERTKNREPHVVPLSAAALAILEARKATQKALGTAPKLAFTNTGTTPFSGFSRGKALLDARITKAGAELAPWRLHDLRRSVATHMADSLKVAPHIIEACLNHVSGTKAGVAGTYNRALYLPERRAALDKWAAYLMRMVGETESDNVVDLAQRRAAS
jgi:integrase